MPLYSVGQLYNPSKTRWPECTQYNFRSGSHELLLFYARPTDREVESIRTGRVDLALAVEASGDLVILVHRFASGPWSDSPFSWHLVPEAERSLPADPESDEERALLSITLVDAATGIIRVLRAVTLSPEFTRSLHDAIRDQAARPWRGASQYNADLRTLYANASCERLAEVRAIARCRGGD